MPKNRQHYRKIKYPDKVTKQNALYLSGYFCLVLWEVEMLISRQPLIYLNLVCFLSELFPNLVVKLICLIADIFNKFSVFNK